MKKQTPADRAAKKQQRQAPAPSEAADVVADADERPAGMDDTPAEAAESADLRAARRAAAVTDLSIPLWEVDDRFFNPFADIHPTHTWLTMGGRRAIPTKGIVSISAKTKQGKSLATYALAIPLLLNQEFGNLKPTDRRPSRIIVFDIEMDEQPLSERLKPLMKKLGAAASRFSVVPLFKVPKAERRAMIEAIIEEFNPDIVIIDQVARLVVDYNSSTESADFGEWLSQLAADRTTITIIHQNKAADNTQMKGHLGSIIDELAVENYSMKRKQGNIFVLTPTSSRYTAIDDDTEPFTFVLSTEGEIIDAAKKIAEQQADEATKTLNMFEVYFGEADTLRHTDLVGRILAVGSGSKASAEREILAAKKLGVVIKTSPDHTAPYRLNRAAVGNPFAAQKSLQK